MALTTAVLAAVPAQAATAPWPSMRHDLANSGRTAIAARYQGDRPWSFATGRGLFITPVIDGAGTIYFGSADHYFYALSPKGRLRWRFRTGGIMDAAAALGPHHTVTIGGADEYLYNLRTASRLTDAQRVVWKYKATLPPAQGQIVDWWEDDVSYGPDGNVYTGNTGGAIYSFTPDGKLRWADQTGNSVWTMPAYGPGGVSYWGSLDRDVRAIDPSGQVKWSTPTLGFVISSPAVGSDGTVYVGSFDSRLYALDPTTGLPKWSFATNDHIYSSPALEQDAQGHTTAIYVASADGSVYKLSPSGRLLWTYDTGDVIRSSLVLGRAPLGQRGDILYFGAGDGTVYALNGADGTRRWSFDTTSADPVLHDRNDLNSSPALGPRGVYIGSEDGNLWYVPYDYCLHRRDARCNTDPGEPFGADLSRVFGVTSGGNTVTGATLGPVPQSSEITARLVVRQGGRTVYAAMQPLDGDASSLVQVSPHFDFSAQLSGDGRYLFIAPTGFLAPDTTYRVSLSGRWLANGVRLANWQLGGTSTGTFGDSFSFHTAPTRGPLPLSAGTDSVSALRLRRLAAPLPAFLPSVNQIGFDSYDLILGTLAVGPPDASGTGSILLWATGAAEGPGGVPVADPATTLAFPLAGRYRDDTLLLSVSGVTLTFSFGKVPLQRFDVRAQVGADGHVLPGANIYAEAQCATIPNYGPATFLTGVCNQKGILPASGTFITDPYPAAGPANRRPAGVSVQSLALTPPTPLTDGALTATLGLAPGASYRADQHRVGLLLVDAQTGQPLGLDYTDQTTSADAAGNVRTVQLRIPHGTSMPARVRAYVIGDVFPLAAKTF